MSSLESIDMFTPSSAAKIGAFGTLNLIKTDRPEPVTEVIVAIFARAAAVVLVSRTRLIDALTSSASKVEPSWNFTFLRSFKRSSVESALKPHDAARPERISSFGPTSTNDP